jgi:glycosyltransferase involved in cell wall biosynthesis
MALLAESLEGGGAERVVRRLAVALAARGHRVSVYCLRSADVPAEDLLTRGVRVREAHSVGRDPLLTWRLGRWLRQDRCAVVHAHSCAALVRVFPAAKVLGIPVLHVWHGWPLETPTRYHRLAAQLDRFVACVGINSESLRARLPITALAQAAAHLPNGLDLPAVAPQAARRRLELLCGRSLDGPVVLSVANVRVEKDLCGLLQAFALLRREHPHAHLVCIGAVRDPAYGQAVRRTAAALSLADRVHFPGPARDAWQLMAGADVFCLSSRSEAMPNVILEALSQRVAVVATAVGDVGCLDAADRGTHWLLQHTETGLLVPPADPAALAAALAGTLRDPAAARQRADRAFEDYRARFTADQMVRRYERLYDQVRRGRRRPDRPAHPPRRPTVLMLGPAPPQIGGMVTSIDLLLKSPLRERYVLKRCPTPVPGRAGRRRLRCLLAALRQTAALARLVTMLVGKRADLLHIHTCSYFTFYRNLLDLAVARLLGRAVILHVRGGQFGRFCESGGRWGQWLIRHGLAASDAVLVVSERWREILQRYAGQTPVYVVPNAVEPAEWPSPRDPNGHTCRFLYLASLTRAKGLSDLLAAAAALRSDGIPFELIVAGPATDEPGHLWKERARQVGLADFTRFVGPVRGSHKARLLAAADCFVHPSHSEAMPNAVLEAAAAGLPVVATAVGCLPEVMVADGTTQPLCPLVPPHDVAALAREMKRLASNAILRQEMGTQLCRHVTTRYSLTAAAERLAQVYDDVLGRSGGRRPRGGSA